jgi:hypothetical protein
MLQEFFIPALQENPSTLLQNTFFQQNGAPPHFAVNFKVFLDSTFLESWVGRGGPINVPAHSRVDFYL